MRESISAFWQHEAVRRTGTAWLNELPGRALETRGEAIGRPDVSEGLLVTAQERSIGSILVPTDFSVGAAKSVEHGVALARSFAAKLILLHVIDINDQAWMRYAGSAEEFMRELRAKARAEMEHQVALLAGEPFEVESVIVEGLPIEEIANRSHDVDLVVISQPPAHRFWQLFSKRTAERVLEEAECGVLVVQE